MKYLAICSALTFLLLFHYKKNNNTIYHNKIISAVGVIVDYVFMPNNAFAHEYTLKLDKIFLINQEYSNRQKLVIKTKEKAHIDVGDAIFLENIHIKSPKNDDHRLFYLRSNILATVYTTAFPGFLINRPRLSLNRYLIHKRNKIIEDIRDKLSPGAFALYTTLFFGRKLGDYEMHEEQNQLFQNWGIVHYLARSGLHVALLLTFWRYAILVLPLPFVAKEIFLLLFIIVYSLISWSSISFIRALCMFALHWYCRINLRASHPFYILVVAFAIIVFFCPYEIYALDFQLTFALTAALLFFLETQRGGKPLFS